uniref:Importin N-terminal domain-containing protein n=1 Tax=Macrostomum lignano TaxID=282301 RepID=A0A1I8FNE3_9PLAT
GSLSLLCPVNEYGPVLADLLLSDQVAPRVRHLACVVLKQYVAQSWWRSPGGLRLQRRGRRRRQFPPSSSRHPVPAAAKQILRDQLLRAIALPESRLRSTAALTVALAAQNDWPDDWPGLFDSLIELLSRPCTELCGAAGAGQGDVRAAGWAVGPVIMPHLLAVLASPDQFPAGVRARAAVTMATLLAFIGQCGRQSAQAYLRQAVDSDSLEDEAADSEGGEFSIQTVCYGLFDFVEAMLASSKFRADLKTSLDDLLVYLVLLMQIRQCDTLDWQENPDKFVAEEELRANRLFGARSAQVSNWTPCAPTWPKINVGRLVRAAAPPARDLPKRAPLATPIGGRLSVLQGRRSGAPAGLLCSRDPPPQHCPALLAATAAALSDSASQWSGVRRPGCHVLTAITSKTRLDRESLLKPASAQMFHGLSSLAFTQGHEVKCLCMERPLLWLCPSILGLRPDLRRNWPSGSGQCCEVPTTPILWLVDLWRGRVHPAGRNPAVGRALRERGCCAPMCSILQDP